MRRLRKSSAFRPSSRQSSLKINARLLKPAAPIADNAYREAMHLSPEQFIQLETIKMQNQVCGINGKATCTFIQNGATPVYNLNK